MSRVLARCALVRHPDSRGAPDISIEVLVSREGEALVLDYALMGDTDAVHWPDTQAPDRKDGLWQTTCFELFIAGEGAGKRYTEVNVSPSTQWAAYAFDGYRAGMSPLAAEISVISTAPKLRAKLSANGVFSRKGRVGLSAVIEARDGTKSYWALAHPDGPPDFHHKDCFALQLEAAGEP